MCLKRCATLAVLLSLSAIPLQTMVVVVVLCGFAARCPAAIVRYGYDGDGAFSEPQEREGNLPNYLLGSKYTVTQPIVLQKAGIVFGSAITNAKVGIYTDAGGAPNTLVAETGSFEVYFDSVLETPLLTTPTIPAGDYWFMAVYDAVETPVVIAYDDSAQVAYIAHTFSSPLPTTFPVPTFYTGVAFAYYLVGETMISGDYNNDGVVDAADYVVYRKGLGTKYTMDNYETWRAHFGESYSPGAGAIVNTAVPEPATIIMLIIGTLAMCILNSTGRSSWQRNVQLN